MKIAIIGTGYVGLVTGPYFASKGHEVVCCDVDEQKIQMLKAGQVPFFEEGLASLIQEGVEAKRLLFTTEAGEAVTNADAVFLCVGTPPNAQGGVDMTYVFQALEDVAPHLSKEAVVISKSTVPVGTAKKIRRRLKERTGVEYAVASNPEFLREGRAVYDVLHPDRIVYGCDDDRSCEVLDALYSDVDCPKVVTSVTSSEMIKYAANAFLATKISFINEVANICEQVGADVQEVSRAIGMDARVSEHFLQAGIGYGGSCFPKDVRALHAFAGETGYRCQILSSVIEVNNAQWRRFVERVKHKLDGVEGKVIGLLGLSFKPNTDDTRESVALLIAKALVDAGAHVQGYDPLAMSAVKDMNISITLKDAPEDVFVQADAVLVTTDWPAFKDLDWGALKEQMRQPKVFDGRQLWSRRERLAMQEQGFDIFAVGDGTY